MSSHDDEMIAFCGLKCSDCPAYIATAVDNSELLEQVVCEWRTAFNSPDISIEDILCDGCQTIDGRLNGYCQHCSIRACGKSQGIPNCAHCKNYSCMELERLLAICDQQTGYFTYANRARMTLHDISIGLIKA
jgi:hypothetical protein